MVDQGRNHEVIRAGVFYGVLAGLLHPESAAGAAASGGSGKSDTTEREVSGVLQFVIGLLLGGAVGFVTAALIAGGGAGNDA